MKLAIQLKRIYESKSENDGKRILVDRIWPRGVSKEEAALDEWLKEVAPSPELRKWFGHDPDRFKEFKERYESELDNDEEKQKAAEKIRSFIKDGKVTLLYAAKDQKHNHAVVLKGFLD
ncbi:DUF488 domain-containing protein [Alkalihalobacillus sp. TS-13]|uniref:DUF488 domain-containing protein n=1 Tax=Alkalihalobacillus sp. TS-13 TaxID=2842455 RepID=UPI001C88490C|nr:DUF488 domain-containing protein [Alkalihalobacillus sp. TS-13]